MLIPVPRAGAAATIELGHGRAICWVHGRWTAELRGALAAPEVLDTVGIAAVPDAFQIRGGRGHSTLPTGGAG